MKTLKYIIALALLIINSSLLIAQDNVYVTGGRTKVIQWKSAGDYSAYNLLFVVVDADDERIIQKTLTQTYATGYTTMLCTLYVSDTEDLAFDASYDYDIAAYGADTITVRRGLFNIIDPVQTSFNGTNLPEGVRVTTISLSNGSEQFETVMWDTTNNYWLPSGMSMQEVIAPIVESYLDTFQVQGGVTVADVEDITADSMAIERAARMSADSNKANLTLNNLGTTSINADLIPSADNNYSIGDATTFWTGIYSGSVILRSSGYFLTVSPAVLNSNKQIYFPDASGTLMLREDTTSLSSRINLKYNTADTTAFNSKSLTTSQLSYKLDKTDTSAFVSDALVNALLTYKLNTSDTLSLSNRINTKLTTINDGIILGENGDQAGTITLYDAVDGSALLSASGGRLTSDGENVLLFSDSTVYATQYDLSLVDAGIPTLPDSIIYTSEIAGKFNTADTTAFNSKNLTTSQLAYKLDKTDTSVFVSDALLNAALAYKFNTSDTSAFVSDALLSASLTYKLNVADSNIYATQNDLSSVTVEGDTSNYSITQIDSLLALAGTALQIDDTTSTLATQYDLTQITAGADSTVFATKYYVDTEIVDIVNSGDARVPFMWAYLQLDTTGSVSDIVDKAEAEVSTLETSGIFGVSANSVVRVAVDSARFKVKYDLGGTPTWTDWLTSSGYYKDVDSAQVQHYSSSSNSTTTLQRFYVSNDVDTFSVTTVAGGGGGGEQMETTRFLAALSTGLASGTETAIDSFVVMLKDTFALDSLSQMFNAIYLHAIETEEASKFNLVKRAHDITESGTDLLWTTNEGWKGDYDGGNVVGTGYLDCNYNFATDTNSIAGRLSIGVTTYIRNSDSTDGPWNNQPIYSVNEGGVGTISLNTRRDDNTGIIRLNDETWSTTFSNASPYVGVYTLDRTGNIRTVYKNSASLFSETQATTGIPNLELWLLRSNTDGVVAGRSSPKQISITMVHRGLTSLTEHQSLRNILEWWMDRWNKGVL